jgi:inner membrane protein
MNDAEKPSPTPLPSVPSPIPSPIAEPQHPLPAATAHYASPHASMQAHAAARPIPRGPLPPGAAAAGDHVVPPSTSAKLAKRAGILIGLILFLLIPLSLIRSAITERTMYRNEAVTRVVANTTGEQKLIAPLLVLPWTDVQDVMAPDASGALIRQQRRISGHVLRAPTTLDVKGALTPNLLRVGLYEVSVYEWRASLKASFAGELPAPAEGTRTWGTPYLVLGISDVRGLVGSPTLVVDGKPATLVAGTRALTGKLDGVHAALPPPTGTALPGATVALDFTLKGTHSLRVVPLGDDTRIAIDSPWPHPKFDGYSPRSQITDDGFKAVWEISSLASNVRASLLGEGRTHELGEDKIDDVVFTRIASADTLQVSLVDPVDIYTQTDRASKYGILFVVLTFVGFIAFELVKRLAIHPLQYFLVGLALALFFLLLLSLSEHIAFWQAYVVSATACIGLQLAYLSGVLKSWLRASGFAVMLTALYGVLYSLLASEDNALLMGSLLLFAVLSAIMWATRKVDWYEVGASLR